jgi:hypothetical protein
VFRQGKWWSPGSFILGGEKMHTINSPTGRWSISVCTCSQDTIHFIYGNATIHIWLGDLRDLGMAMQRIAEGLQQATQNSNGNDKKRVLQ